MSIVSARWRRLTLAGVLAGAVALTSACTYRVGQQAEVDFAGAHTRIYIYQKPSWLVAGVLRDVCASKHPGNRTAQGRCGLTILRGAVQVEGVQGAIWTGRFVNVTNDQAGDFMSATDDVRAAGFVRDGGGQWYARRCLTGDWVTGSPNDANWTFRVDADGHCKRGSYPKN